MIHNRGMSALNLDYHILSKDLVSSFLHMSGKKDTTKTQGKPEAKPEVKAPAKPAPKK